MLAMLVLAGALLLSGCRAAPERPTCNPTPRTNNSLNTAVAQGCRAELEAYNEYDSLSFGDKLFEGYSSAWYRLGGGALIGVLAIAGIRAIAKPRPTPAPPPPQQTPEPQPQAPSPPVAHSLIGAIVRFNGVDYTIIDDSFPSVVTARTGGRATVTAADPRGDIGLLFLGFDDAGAVTEAATQSISWGPATLMWSAA
uniref:hypothetical protein n=1 Tax=Mycolicibacterium sp. CBMA 213 TaxID=1968788 RepID=UPI00155D9A10|nr:hypothetical protein [Mycolicibacterium sp. CBMA 213]